MIVVGGGKASVAMAQAVEEVLGDRITGWAGQHQVRLHGASHATSQINEAGHPFPDDSGQEGGRRMLELVARRRARTRWLLCLISGGGSALLVSPAEGLTSAPTSKA